MKNKLIVVSEKEELTHPDKGMFAKSVRCWGWRLKFTGDLPRRKFAEAGCVGVDSGVSTGVAILGPSGKITAYLLKMPSRKHVSRVKRMRFTYRHFISEHIGLSLPESGPVVIEDAAFMRPHGQVALAESRTAAMLGMMSHGDRDYYLVNPRSLWKRVFGSAKIIPKELWEHLSVDGNVLDAVAAALYGVFEYGF